MTHLSNILADDSDTIGKVIFGAIAVVIWIVGAIAKQSGKSSQKQKERLRQVRESIERDQALQQRQVRPPALDPEIARRLPPMILQRPRPTPANRPATNYNAMTQQPRTAPPPIAGQRIPPPVIGQRTAMRQPDPRPAAARPRPQVAQKRRGPALPVPPPVAAAILEPVAPPNTFATPAKSPPLQRPVARPTSVNAATIKRWATPETLRQQFILTEVFQPPLALRNDSMNWFD